MAIFLVFSTDTSKPDKGDEVKGYSVNEADADEYCKIKNQLVGKNVSYWYETVEELKSQ